MQPDRETQRLISEMLGNLNAPGSAPATAIEWQCIAVWALAGYLVASGQASPEQGVVELLTDAAGLVDCQRLH